MWIRAARGGIPDQWIGVFGTRYDVVAFKPALELLRATPEDDGAKILAVHFWVLVVVTGVLPTLRLGWAVLRTSGILHHHKL